MDANIQAQMQAQLQAEAQQQHHDQQQYAAQQHAMQQHAAQQQQQQQAQQQHMQMQQMQMASQMMPPPARNTSTILCCLCASPIAPNPSNMCLACIRTNADVTQNIGRFGTVFQCRTCLRFLGSRWIACQLESRELLALLLKKCSGLNKGTRLTDAGFVWTEEHSKRIKVRLTVQGEVLGGTILQQNAVVEFEVKNQQCADCQRAFTPHEGWSAVVQLRQKVTHKRTFLYLEQLMLKHRAHADAIKVKQMGDGLDFMFSNRSHASKFVDFIHNVAPARARDSKKLISQDFSSNTATYNYTFSVEIAPVCKDDIVLLPIALARQLGSMSPLLLVTRISSLIHLIDPITLNHAEIAAPTYWHSPFRPLMERSQLKQYMVIDVEPLGPQRGRNVLSECTVARMGDMGFNDTMFTTNTHLGAFLKPGDTVMGYDFANANVNCDLTVLRDAQLPDVVLVRKVYVVRKRRKKRVFKLDRMDKEDMETMGRKGKTKGNQAEIAQKEYEGFLRDLEEDPEMRQKINLYPKGPEDDTHSMASTQYSESQEDDPTFPEVKLEELMSNLTMQEQTAHAYALMQAQGAHSALQLAANSGDVDAQAQLAAMGAPSLADAHAQLEAQALAQQQSLQAQQAQLLAGGQQPPEPQHPNLRNVGSQVHPNQ